MQMSRTSRELVVEFLWGDRSGQVAKRLARLDLLDVGHGDDVRRDLSGGRFTDFCARHPEVSPSDLALWNLDLSESDNSELDQVVLLTLGDQLVELGVLYPPQSDDDDGTLYSAYVHPVADYKAVVDAIHRRIADAAIRSVVQRVGSETVGLDLVLSSLVGMRAASLTPRIG
jgi:hypothetical protein